MCFLPITVNFFAGLLIDGEKKAGLVKSLLIPRFSPESRE
jgi:hypothetical protein